MMTFDQWLDEEKGRATMLSKHFGVRLQAVWEWRTNGVPRDKILAVHELTRRRVSLRALLSVPAARPLQVRDAVLATP